MHAQPDQRKKEMKADVYKQVIDKIIADLERGELTWLKPWSAGNMDGRITLRFRSVLCLALIFMLLDRYFKRMSVSVVASPRNQIQLKTFNKFK